MNQQHLNKLEDIANCCDKPLKEVEELYKHKMLQYMCRYGRLGLYLESDYYQQRAMKVIQQYATKKWNYRESWIE